MNTLKKHLAFFALCLVLPFYSQASQVYQSSFNFTMEDIPASLSSDQDRNDIYGAADSKIHVNSLGEVRKVIVTFQPIAFGAKHDLNLIVGAGLSGAELLIHGDSSVTEESMPYTLYVADQSSNGFFEGCSKTKMINVFENDPSCDGKSKTFTIIFSPGNRPVFSSYNSSEEFVAQLISVQNVTLGSTLTASIMIGVFKI